MPAIDALSGLNTALTSLRSGSSNTTASDTSSVSSTDSQSVDSASTSADTTTTDAQTKQTVYGDSLTNREQKEADLNKDGEVSYQEYREYLDKLKEEARKEAEKAARQREEQKAEDAPGPSRKMSASEEANTAIKISTLTSLISSDYRYTMATKGSTIDLIA